MERMRKILFAVLGLLFFFPLVLVLYWHWQYPEPHWDWSASNTNEVKFPREFLWGVASAAHQVEGDCHNNNWSAWENARDTQGRPRIKNAQVAGKACEHWTRFREDIRLMQELGVKAYRFSMEWSKIEPSEGVIDSSALRHYHEVCAALLVAGIKPVVTLHHFTHPLWFEARGAFEREENIAAFVRFSELLFREFHEQVEVWCTLNEPEVFAAQGYFLGVFPPGKQDPRLTAEVLKNLLLAHVQVYERLKQLPGGAQAKIGLVKNIMQFEPSRRWHPLDWLLAHKLNALFTESILDFFQDGDFDFSMPGLASLHYRDERATHALDFIGLNYYSHLHVKFNWSTQEFFKFTFPDDAVMTDMPYTIYPEGFYRALQAVQQLGVPIYVTENGIADARDDRRALFITRYLYALQRAMQEGADVRGYFYWSLTDNFEWAEGYDMKFGLYEVDFNTQERKLREGAKAFVQAVKGEK